MTTTHTEPPAQEYDRLFTEMVDIEAAARRDGQITPDAQRRHANIKTRLRALVAVPPPGYTVPTAAADLIAHATAHGWQTSVQWTRPGWHGEPYVQVQVGRRLTAEEAADHRSDVFLFQLTWHSRGCPRGRLRRFGTGLARTPDQPATHNAPSLKAIRALITAHPAPAPGEETQP